MTLTNYKKIIFFDTETSGFPKNLPKNDPKQPEIVRFAYMTCAPNGVVLNTVSQIFQVTKPIPFETTEVHGIDETIAADYGVSPNSFFKVFKEEAKDALLVAYNKQFDLKMLDIHNALNNIQFASFCVLNLVRNSFKEQMAEIQKLKFGAAKPSFKLGKVYESLFDVKPEGAHDPLMDIHFTRQIYGFLTQNMLQQGEGDVVDSFIEVHND